MKKIFALICVMFLFAVAANAYDNGGSKNASADINCTVITPLTIIQGDALFDLTSAVVVEGTDRTFTNQSVIDFAIGGEPDKYITVTPHGPSLTGASDAGNGYTTADDVTLLGAGWSAIPTQLNGSGNADINYTVSGVHAGTHSHGVYTFSLSIDVIYVSL